MDFLTLTTDRLLLRRITPDEMAAIFAHYPKPQIMELLGHRSEDDFLKEKAKVEKGYTTYNRSVEFFQLIDKPSGKIIGGAGFHNWYFDHRRAELGYAMADDNFKNQGLMTEALATIIGHGFGTMNLHRIEALVGSENTPSLKLMDRFRFVREGL